MALFLPPMIPPQQASDAELKQGLSAARVIQVKNLRLHLAGCDAIPRQELEQSLQSAKSPTDLVLEVARLLYIHLSPAARADYAMAGSDLYVICQPQRIDRIAGTPGLQPYFSDLRGQTAPAERRFEKDRVLAELYSQRVGLDSGLKLQPEGGNNAALDAVGVDNGSRRLYASADYSNAGNRFVGRNILGTDWRYGSPAADEYRLTWKHALGGDSAAGAAGRYDEGQASWSPLSRSGLWQLTGHGFFYTQDMSAGNVDGHFVEGSLSWAQVANADWNARSLFQLRGTYADRASSVGGTDLLAERYAYAEPSLTYAVLREYDGSQLNIDSAVSVPAGSLLGSTTLTPASRSIMMLRGSLHPEWKHPKWGKAGLNLYGQWSAQRLPEELQLVLGGPAALAAYLPGALYGDSAAIGRLYGEHRLMDAPRFTLNVRVYAEYGAAHLHSAVAAGTPSATTHGADVGIGLAAEAGKTLSVTLDLAQAVSSRSNSFSSDVPGVYASVVLHN
jgi:hypothetical protein